MAETAGPVFEGVGRPEVQPKKGIVEGLKEKWKANIEKNKEEIAKQKQKKEDWKKLGPEVEEKYIASFDRITKALGEGKIQQVVEKVRPIVKLNAKLARVSSAAVDITLGTVPLVAGSLIRGVGISALWSDMTADRTGGKYYRAGQVFKAIGMGSVAASLGAGILWFSPARRASAFMSDIVGAGGEKVVQIAQKILKKEPQTQEAPVHA